MPKFDRTYFLLAGAVLLLALILGGKGNSGGSGTYGGGEPTYPQAEKR
jgi:hypothetical protein